jgi:hypothetical protein
LYNIGYLFADLPRYKAENRGDQLHDLSENLLHAYNQQVFLSSFKIAYEFLKQCVVNEAERQALQWLAEQAAQVGSADGHAALAELAATDAEKWFHLELAARLMDEKGDRRAEADALRKQAADIGLDEDEIQHRRQSVQAWTRPDPAINLPPDIPQRFTEASQDSGGR